MSSSVFRLKKHIIETQYIRQYPHATINGEEDDLKICVNQYTPLSNLKPQPGDVTIIAAHANGVGKEMYEPLWDELLALSTKTGAFKIRNIWIADVAWQGESGVLNENKLGNDPSWFDHSRDLLHMVNHFRREMPRPLIGLGHSMGGAQITNLALLHPRLLHSVVLMEPVMQSIRTKSAATGPALASTFRRDIWPSREAAAASFRNNKFYADWDPRCLDIWIKTGLRDLPTALYPTFLPTNSASATQAALSAAAAAVTAAPVPSAQLVDIPVTLTTTKHQEVFTFLRPMHPSANKDISAFTPTRITHPDLLPQPYGPSQTPAYRPEPILLFGRLPHLRPHCLYIFGTTSQTSTPEMCAEKLRDTGVGWDGSGGVQTGAVQSVSLEGGHFVPFEKPGVVAAEVEKWLSAELSRWHDEERILKEQWQKLKGQDKITLSEDWKWWMKQGKKPFDLPGTKAVSKL